MPVIKNGIVANWDAEVVSSQDYSSFGAALTGRSFNNGGYRYGFNGKEKDNTIGNDDYDYGMRIYDARIAKFLSVDPLTKKYPELTPYQFASNRPIDGLDLDGLEYITANYNLTINKGKTALSASYVWTNSLTHSEHGGLGQGVVYNIKIRNNDNNTEKNVSQFVSRGGNSFASYITQYGNYMGSAPLSNFDVNTGNLIANTYRYDVPAVDYVDEQAKLHDKGYDRVNAVGASGLFNDWAATPYDEAALNNWNNFRDKYKNGGTDPFNGQPIYKQSLDAAWRGATLFSGVVHTKKVQISNFMMNYYRNEVLNGSSNHLENSYQLFLKKYMKKDEDGNWIRNEEMWSGDKEKGFTPIAPKAKNKNE